MNQELLTSRVPRALEMKSKLLGFELPDLLLIFFNLGLTNLLFGASNLRYLLVWGTTLSLASVLYFAKRGKPDNYIEHLIEFYLKPTYFSAGRPDQKFKPLHIGSTNEANRKR